MNNKQTNPLPEWEIPSIFDIIDRLSFSWLDLSRVEEKTPKESNQKKRKYTKRSKKKL
jgi:hypothetical protein